MTYPEGEGERERPAQTELIHNCRFLGCSAIMPREWDDSLSLPPFVRHIVIREIVSEINAEGGNLKGAAERDHCTADS